VSQWQCPKVEEEGDTMAGDKRTIGENYVLNEIECAEGPISTAGIAANLDFVPVSFIERDLDRLEAKGLIKRTDDRPTSAPLWVQA
jgi:DNA-binding HxlR family transcriptional regulator